MPRDLQGRPGTPREYVLGAQRELRRLLVDAGSSDVAINAANQALRFGRQLGGSSDLSLRPDGRMALTVQTLLAFMCIEIAMVAAYGACVGSCKRCGNFFLYGRATKRRSTATYCRDLCRVGAHRATKRGTEDVSQKAQVADRKGRRS